MPQLSCAASDSCTFCHYNNNNNKMLLTDPSLIWLHYGVSCLGGAHIFTGTLFYLLIHPNRKRLSNLKRLVCSNSETFLQTSRSNTVLYMKPSSCLTHSLGSTLCPWYLWGCLVWETEAHIAKMKLVLTLDTNCDGLECLSTQQIDSLESILHTLSLYSPRSIGSFQTTSTCNKGFVYPNYAERERVIISRAIRMKIAANMQANSSTML